MFLSCLYLVYKVTIEAADIVGMPTTTPLSDAKRKKRLKKAVHKVDIRKVSSIF